MSNLMIFDLPIELEINIFSYFKLNDIVILDNSILNNFHRYKLLHILSQLKYIHQVCVYNKNILVWLHKRQINLILLDVGKSLNSWKSLSYWTLYNGNFIDEYYMKIFPISKYLISLQFKYCLHLTSTSLFHILNYCCDNLEILKIYHCPIIDDSAFMGVFLNIKELVIHDCECITSQTYAHIAISCIRIESLDILCHEYDNDDTMQSISLCIENNKHLKSLHLATNSDNLIINNQSLSCIKSNSLEKLSFSLANRYLITENALIKMIINFPRLLVIDIARKYCEMRLVLITDLTMDNIAMHCPNLVELYISRCKDITNKGIKNVVKSCRLLKYLIANHCEKLTNRVLKYIAKYGNNLEVLQLEDIIPFHRSLYFTKASILLVLHNCLKLILFSLGCSGIYSNVIDIKDKYICFTCHLFNDDTDDDDELFHLDGSNENDLFDNNNSILDNIYNIVDI